MGRSSAVTEDSATEWSTANLKKLLASMKSCIPEDDSMSAYTEALKSVDWNEVAFPPFSPEECQEKWRRILKKMRKIRTLAELIDEAEDVISNPVQNTKNHPEHPKRPSPPNAIYYEENCAKYLKEHPKMSLPKVFQDLSKQYRELPDEEKAQYVEKYKLSTKEYTRRMRLFSKQFTNTNYQQHVSCQKRKKLSADSPDQVEQHNEDEDGMPPKPPFNGYNLFCKEQCASMTGFSGKTYVTLWAQRWRNLTDAQREEYSTRCRELKKQYTIKLNNYLKTFDKEKQQQILNEKGIKRPPVSKNTDRKRSIKLPGEPKLPSRFQNQTSQSETHNNNQTGSRGSYRSGFGIFCKYQMRLLRKKFPNSRERFSKINHMWQDLSDQEKTRYKGEASEDIRKYTVELQNWFKTLPAAKQAAYRKHNPSKIQYLEGTEGPCHAAYRPSDSEDEDIEDSSSDDEENSSDCCEVEEEEDNSDVSMFEMY